MVKTCNSVSPARCAPGVAQHGTGQCGTADCGTAQHGVAQHGRARHSTTKHSRSSSPLAIPRAPQRRHRRGVQPLSPDPVRVHPGQHSTARHGRTLPQGCPYVPGCSTPRHEQGQGEQQQQPGVPVAVVAVCGTGALPAPLPAPAQPLSQQSGLWPDSGRRTRPSCQRTPGGRWATSPCPRLNGLLFPGPPGAPRTMVAWGGCQGGLCAMEGHSRGRASGLGCGDRRHCRTPWGYWECVCAEPRQELSRKIGFVTWCITRQ